MWSLYEISKKGNQEVLNKLDPITFTNKKNQEDIVNEIIKEVKAGNKIIFLRGVCGSGKSAIALNVAKELGKTSIVVPIKNLQRQYEQDYISKKVVFKDSKLSEKLKINMITGRKNHPCRYLNENKELLEDKNKFEVNKKIFDIFNSNKKETFRRDDSADNSRIPCKIEIKEKNIERLKRYYRENTEKRKQEDLDISILKRMAVAPACPYWCPILPESLKVNIEAKNYPYESISGNHIYYKRKPGCSYYEQFESYINSDVIIFNSQNYVLETHIGRKPKTEIEIIDEGDEFLDSFSIEGSINLKRLQSESKFLYSNEEDKRKLIDSLNQVLSEISLESNRYHEEEIIEMKKTNIKELIKLFAHNDYYGITNDEDSYIEKCNELCKRFYDVIEESYISFSKDNFKKEDLIIKLVTINLKKVLDSLIEKNKAIVFMSGTLHSEKIIKEVFGIEEYKIIEAETYQQGSITKIKTGFERDFRYENFQNNSVNRKQYLVALNECVKKAKRPTIIHLTSFLDLPNESEKQDLCLDDLITFKELTEKQNEDKTGELVKEFKNGKTNVLFTTRCNRGVDFPFETCNSVIISKFPYPPTNSLFWKVLRKNKPHIFWEFYKDKAHRELLQKIYRSIRHKEDHVDLLSPDIRVLNSGII